jgi:enoyl-CoA hydratase/carnithine racemase
MDTYEHILTQQLGHTTTVTLNRPQAFNALSDALLCELLAEFNRIAMDGSIRVVVLAATGKAFCTGHDLKQLAGMANQVNQYADLFKLCSQVMLRIQSLPQPVIAKVHGLATAAGCQLVGMCDLAVAADTAQFATSGINFGLFCATPSVPLLRTMPRKHAMQMLLTGDFISATQAASQGLINQSVPADQLDPTVQFLCERIAEHAPYAIALGKKLVYQQAHIAESAAYQLAAQTMAHNMTLACAQSGVAKFTNKAKPADHAR